MPGYEQIAIVMVTSSLNERVRIEALEAGATDFLSKSSDAAEFRARLRNMINLSVALRRLTVAPGTTVPIALAGQPHAGRVPYAVMVDAGHGGDHAKGGPHHGARGPVRSVAPGVYAVPRLDKGGWHTTTQRAAAASAPLSVIAHERHSSTSRPAKRVSLTWQRDSGPAAIVVEPDKASEAPCST